MSRQTVSTHWVPSSCFCLGNPFDETKGGSATGQETEGKETRIGCRDRSEPPPVSCKLVLGPSLSLPDRYSDSRTWRLYRNFRGASQGTKRESVERYGRWTAGPEVRIGRRRSRVLGGTKEDRHTSTKLQTGETTLVGVVVEKEWG